MKLLVFVLNRAEELAPVLEKLETSGFGGATVLSSSGMARTLSKYFGGSLLGTLYAMTDTSQDESKTVFMIIKDENTEKVVSLIEKEIGSFDSPNTGIVFTVPVDFAKGIH